MKIRNLLLLASLALSHAACASVDPISDNALDNTRDTCSVSVKGEVFDLALQPPCTFMKDPATQAPQFRKLEIGKVFIILGKPATAEQLAKWRNVSPELKCSKTGRHVIIRDGKAYIGDRVIRALMCPSKGLDAIFYMDASVQGLKD